MKKNKGKLTFEIKNGKELLAKIFLIIFIIFYSCFLGWVFFKGVFGLSTIAVSVLLFQYKISGLHFIMSEITCICIYATWLIITLNIWAWLVNYWIIGTFGSIIIRSLEIIKQNIKIRRIKCQKMN